MTIGAKCTLCGKQRKYHSSQSLRCPTGKRHRHHVSGVLWYSSFIPGSVFTPKLRPKGKQIAKKAAKRKKPMPKGTKRNHTAAQKKHMAALRLEGCCACGNMMNTEVHHLRTRGSGGSNHPSNLIPLCRGCHTGEPWAWHRSRKQFFGKFPHVIKRMFDMGWARPPNSNMAWPIIPPKTALTKYQEPTSVPA